MAKYFTPAGIEKLHKELVYLEQTKVREASERVRLAAAQGDLKENAGYDIAKEDLRLIEIRITELKTILAQVKVAEPQSTDKVQIGSWVDLELVSEKTKETFQIVEPEEADVLNNKISFQSPLGSAIFKKRKGAIIEVATPVGKNKYKIINIK